MTRLQRLQGQGLGAVGGFGARGRSRPLQGDDADAVFGFFDSPPPPEAVDERDGGHPPPSTGEGGGCTPGQHRGGGTVPVFLPNAGHQEVTGC